MTGRMKKLLNADIKELNACFNSKAYKATLILAGSILEAVLIDWLGEMDNCDYFNNNYYVVKKDKRGKDKRRSAKLYDYIKEVESKKEPNWDLKAMKANEIRNMRNLVHAKLGIMTDKINEVTCRKIICNLEEIIRYRDLLQ